MTFYDDLGIWLSKLILAKGAVWVIKITTALGIGFISYGLILQPLLDWAITKWQSMPGSIAQWLSALGVDVAVSIVLSAYGFRGTERLLLGKRGP
ncbi:hypothetical protein LC55x_2713 [Lysobacter capsici]|uniref:DUF2523 family protein n=1 Tax=Lysobacter capsici TaxID=435897 RepID=UPI000716551A|nr:DUF2523 family protein [Lysobacter capsici]ALN85978.1 hypothetical protein LC55x_2713 [Lysobacter capsici]